MSHCGYPYASLPVAWLSAATAVYYSASATYNEYQLPPADYAHGRCYSCGGLGHWARQCPQGSSYGGTERGSSRNNGIPSPFSSCHGIDPADYGWTYQGCCVASKVEFWEREGVRLDYYPTTGTVKTSLLHPSQGRTQMFRRNLSANAFIRVLVNPRQHTGRGYQTRQPY